MHFMKKQWSYKLKFKGTHIQAMLFFIISIMLLLFTIYVGISYPYISYEGDRNIPKEDIIHFYGLTFRDLRKDHITEYNGKSLTVKYYIVKKSLLPKKSLLKFYCSEQYNTNKVSDIVSFHFYQTSGKMPFYWKDEDPFPDLEICSDYLLGVYWVTDDEIKFDNKY